MTPHPRTSAFFLLMIPLFLLRSPEPTGFVGEGSQLPEGSTGSQRLPLKTVLAIGVSHPQNLRLRDVRKTQESDSTIIAIPCPPPMHAVASPYLALRRRSS